MRASIKKILITGGAGFVGSHIVKRCVEKGHKISLLLRSSSDTSRIKDILPEIEHIYYGDLADTDEVRSIFNEAKPSGVFHLATSPIMSGAISSSREVVNSNILGAVNLMDAAADIGVDFFINTGTFLEYASQNRPLKEDDPCEPMELYGISKLAATRYGQAISRSKNMPVVTLRFFTPYGPAVQKGRLIYEVVSKALQGKDIKLTAPSVSRDFVFVGDLPDLYLEAAAKARLCRGGIFNAASGTLTTLEQLAQMVLKITRSKSKIVWGELLPTAYDATPWQADMYKTFSTFSWRPAHGLEDGLKQTAEWYQKNARI